MSDPKPTIRIEGVCRGDGRCPECGNPPHLNSRGVALRLPCGCEFCLDWTCEVKHLHALLTEALRQLYDQRERGDQAEAARVTQLTESIEVLQRVEAERDAAIRRADYWQTSEAVHVVVQERDATIRERDEARDSVAMLNACVTGLTARAEKAEALLRECLVVLDPWAWDLLVARIREALPK